MEKKGGGRKHGDAGETSRRGKRQWASGQS